MAPSEFPRVVKNPDYFVNGGRTSTACATAHCRSAARRPQRSRRGASTWRSRVRPERSPSPISSGRKPADRGPQVERGACRSPHHQQPQAALDNVTGRQALSRAIDRRALSAAGNQGRPCSGGSMIFRRAPYGVWGKAGSNLRASRDTRAGSRTGQGPDPPRRRGLRSETDPEGEGPDRRSRPEWNSGVRDNELRLSDRRSRCGQVDTPPGGGPAPSAERFELGVDRKDGARRTRSPITTSTSAGVAPEL